MALEQSGQQSSKHSWLQDRNPTAKSLQTTDYILVFSNCRHSEVISSCVPKDAQRCNIQASIPQRTRMAGKGSSSPLGFRGWQIIVGSIRGFAVLRGLLKCIAPNLFPQYAVIGLAWETSGTRESRARQGWGGPAHGIPSVTENEQWRCSTCYCDEDLGAQLGCISALHISASAGAATEDSCGQGQEQPGVLREAAVLNGITIACCQAPLPDGTIFTLKHWSRGVERVCVSMWLISNKFSYFPFISLVWMWADRETQQTSNPLTVSCRASNFPCLLGRPPSLSQNLTGARAPCLPSLAQWTANSTPHPQTFAFNYPEFNHGKQILPGHNFKRAKNKCCRSQTVISDPPSRFTAGFFSCPCYVVLVSEPLPGHIYKKLGY